MIQNTIKYANDKHSQANHFYDDKPYIYHLNCVFEVAQQFKHLLKEEDIENVFCGCYVHDIIEDARETYNDVLNNTNKTVAELAYALTNEKGKNRSERASDKYYSEMHLVPNAVFIKLCDRIANITYSKNKGSSMFNKYKKENDRFIQQTYRPELMEMINYILQLLT